MISPANGDSNAALNAVFGTTWAKADFVARSTNPAAFPTPAAMSQGSAEKIARLACAKNDFVPGESLEPIYLRETNFVKAPPPRVLPNL